MAASRLSTPQGLLRRLLGRGEESSDHAREQEIDKMSKPTAEDSEELKLFARAKAEMPWSLAGMPFIPSQTNFETSMPKLASQFHGEFCWATCYEPEFLAELMYNGFLTMAMAHGSCEVITPKLHVRRSLVMFADVPKPHSGTMKKSKKFEFSADTCFAEVAAGIVEQHGPSWFYPNLVKLFTKMNSMNDKGLHNGKVRVHSFEVWQEGKLVAGECGYSCGRVYTSLSGFTRADSAGTVQMYAMASHLKTLGFAVWDLGMQLGYKEKEFHARSVPRLEFLSILRQYRDDIVEAPVKIPSGIPSKPLLAALAGPDASMKDKTSEEPQALQEAGDA